MEVQVEDPKSWSSPKDVVLCLFCKHSIDLPDDGSDSSDYRKHLQKKHSLIFNLSWVVQWTLKTRKLIGNDVILSKSELLCRYFIVEFPASTEVHSIKDTAESPKSNIEVPKFKRKRNLLDDNSNKRIKHSEDADIVAEENEVQPSAPRIKRVDVKILKEDYSKYLADLLPSAIAESELTCGSKKIAAKEKILRVSLPKLIPKSEVENEKKLRTNKFTPPTREKECDEVSRTSPKAASPTPVDKIETPSIIPIPDPEETEDEWYFGNKSSCLACNFETKIHSKFKEHVLKKHNSSLSKFHKKCKIYRDVKYECKICGTKVVHDKIDIKRHVDDVHCLTLEQYARFYEKKININELKEKLKQEKQKSPIRNEDSKGAIYKIERKSASRKEGKDRISLVNSKEGKSGNPNEENKDARDIIVDRTSALSSDAIGSENIVPIKNNFVEPTDQENGNLETDSIGKKNSELNSDRLDSKVLNGFKDASADSSLLDPAVPRVPKVGMFAALYARRKAQMLTKEKITCGLQDFKAIVSDNSTLPEASSFDNNLVPGASPSDHSILPEARSSDICMLPEPMLRQGDICNEEDSNLSKVIEETLLNLEDPDSTLSKAIEEMTDFVTEDLDELEDDDEDSLNSPVVQDSRSPVIPDSPVSSNLEDESLHEKTENQATSCSSSMNSLSRLSEETLAPLRALNKSSSSNDHEGDSSLYCCPLCSFSTDYQVLIHKLQQ